MRTPLPAWIKVLLVITTAGLAATTVVIGTAGTAHAHPLRGVRQVVAAPAPAPSPDSARTSAPGTVPADPASTTAPPTAPPSRSSTPASGPGQSPSTGPAGSGSGGCGFFDLACEFGQAVNGFFRGLVSYALNVVPINR